ncbi:cell division control protein 6 homolog, partial [Notothenia coriiceps]|uniref:Cell division control protein 6 homolog n=1 Tax=Notothenia coriiceps TaxID=8208 RepID=A0A6I9MTU6_9TELE
MPSTRSNGQAQPTLAFPRRKSCRVSSHGKTPQREESPAASPSKPETQNLNLGRIGPMSPRRPAVARTSALSSPLSLRAPPSSRDPPSSPRLQTRLPLSPRKRTGDDNGCNLGGSSLLGSPPKQSRPAVNSPRKLSFGENSPLSVRRRLVPSLSPRKPSSPNTGSSPRRQDTPSGTPEGKQAVSRLFAEKSRFLSVKQALHTALPERLLSREVERDAIRCFLRDKALQRVPGSLYISGAPGTGKTACFNCVLKEMEVLIRNCPAYDLSFSEVRGQSLVVLWKAPVYIGASAVSGYLVEMAKGSSEFVTLNEEAVSHRYLQ